MSLRQGGVVAAIAVLVVASIACGERDRDGGKSGEDLSAAGSRSAGRSGTGGRGGTSGSGTAGSVAGASGHGGSTNPPECPAQAPPDWGDCPSFGLSCRYERALCDCGMTEEGMVWDCQTQRAPQMCPGVEPISGSACMGDGGCLYGTTRGCRCIEDSQTWACWDPAECPSELPANDSACSPIGMACGYRDGGCECAASGWSCMFASDMDAGS